ncbi:hypothetical protein IT084_02605 [Desulfallas sp. Bu1-1]|uniref:hypothetical protein n=1 Tax=Desulfallas sp. Bu1-1 TaxID=2787620 RepID=UPI00189C649C|nr:hypothetical protein [Desulfallas sp. Bu1-1]MBF7081865.1 hypothetical protein [Desulfallas sp. Bu1-1]
MIKIEVFKIVSENEMPEKIIKKISATIDDVKNIIQSSETIQETKVEGSFRFTFKHSAPTDILTALERAQQVSFVTKYEHLPILDAIEIIKLQGKFYLKNIDYIRHVLNEYRTIIANQNDSIFYTRIHGFCYQKLKNRDPSIGLSIIVEHVKTGDITDLFARILGERVRAVRTVLQNCEFDYIYNGILQHSDPDYTERYWDEYYTGKINYVFLKHALLLGYIKELLYWHYRIINSITFPKLGPL